MLVFLTLAEVGKNRVNEIELVLGDGLARLAKPIVNQLSNPIVILCCTKDSPLGRVVLDDVQLVELQIGLQVLYDFHFCKVLTSN